MSYRLVNANDLAIKYPEVNEMPCIYVDLPDGLDNEYHVVVNSDLLNGIVLSNSITNGDMIKALFPNANEWEVTEPKAVAGHYFYFGDGTIKIFSLAWWNAPYKGDKEGGK